MAKWFSWLLCWFLILLLQTETGNGSNNATSKSGVIKLRVGVPQKYGFPQLVDVDLLVSDSGKEKQQASGYCIDVFNAVVERLNLPYKVSLHFKYYVIDSNSSTTYDSVLHKIPKELDMVVGDITIRASRSEFLDFTVPYASSGVRMVVSVQHGKRQTMWIFVKPFNWALWFSIIIFSTFVGLSILFMERNVKVLPNQHGFPNPVKLNPATILWFPISQAILPERQVVAKNCSRFVLMVWILLTLVLMQSYTANLTSILTLDQLRPSFLNVDDLSKGGYYVGYQAGSFVKDMLIQQFKFDPSKLRAYSNISEYYDALNIGSQGGGVAAIFDELLFLKVFLQQFGSKYVMTGPIYKTNGFGFAFPLNSSLTAYFSRAILNVTESDLMNQIEEKYFEMNNGLGGREEQYAEKSQSLNFYSFSGLFLITGIATLLALLISETTFIWQRLILMAKAFSQRYLFPSPPSVETRVHPTHDSTTQNTENRNHLTRPPPEFLTDGN